MSMIKTFGEIGQSLALRLPEADAADLVIAVDVTNVFTRFLRSILEGEFARNG